MISTAKVYRLAGAARARRSGGLVAAAIAIAWTAFSGQSAAQPQVGTVPASVKVGTVVGSYACLATYVAFHRGFLAEELKKIGTKPELVELQGSPASMNAVLGRDVASTCTTTPTALQAVASGAAVTQLLTFVNTDPGLVIVRKGISADRRTFGDKTWGISQFGSSLHASMLNVAKFMGYDGAKLKIVAMGAPNSYAAAFKRGDVDIAVMGIPTAEDLLIAGEVELVMDLWDPKVVTEMYGGLISTTGLFANPATVKEMPGVTRAVVRAHVRALEFIQANAKTPEAILKILPGNLQTKNIVPVIRRITPAHAHDGTVEVSSVQRVLDGLVKTGLIKANEVSRIDPKAFADNSWR